MQTPSLPRHNLLPRSFTTLVGRDGEVKLIFDRLLSHPRGHVLAIEGIGGVGKTALAQEVAWRLKDQYASLPPEQRFAFVVWASFKQVELTSNGVEPVQGTFSTLHHLCSAVAKVIQAPKLLLVLPEGQYTALLEALREVQQVGRVLLILDNLESASDPDCARLLAELPEPHTALITTRPNTALGWPHRLNDLDDTAMRLFITQTAERLSLTLRSQSVARIAEASHGLPLAASWIVGVAKRIGVRRALSRFQTHFNHQGDELLRFIFNQDLDSLRESDPCAYHLLLALAFFDVPTGAPMTILLRVLDCDSETFDRASQTLIEGNLVTRRDDGSHYRILHITQQFALVRMQLERDWEGPARNRWVDAYLRLTRAHGGPDGPNWHVGYNQVEAEWKNLLVVFDWCKAHDRDGDLCAFWLEDRVQQFSDLYGHWTERLEWYAYLIEAGRRRHQLAICSQARLEIGWTLSLMGHTAFTDRADRHFRRAWRSRHHLSARDRGELANNIAALRIRQGRLRAARNWLRIHEDLCDNGAMPLAQAQRQRIHALYYRGMLAFLRERWDEAEVHFNEMRAASVVARYPRAGIYARNYLADIMTERGKLEKAAGRQENADARFGEAAIHLRQVRTEAGRHHDERRLALCLRSQGILAEAQGDSAQARVLFESARDHFNRLNMRAEEQEMENRLRDL